MFLLQEKKLSVKEEVGLRDKTAKNSDNFFSQFVSKICKILWDLKSEASDNVFNFWLCWEFLVNIDIEYKI